ncbi:outer membrane beta-barrel protein [Chryseobacterium sp. MFBS3-17]|uniref:outer membrane beta-barrel protein n=1 Tax=Chryseobacterium sp. MFBS3-17 TaxID=2886689 RepID=UPI001D0E015E|nr:outer membrane beta-barrel protein [Chryseobacterium sp. MFBS3-17]MCC2590846.1 PorT family protein [Chryseobacterium sp. MFBS3-17]
MKKLYFFAFLAMSFFATAQSGNGVGDGIFRYGISLKAHQSNIRGIHQYSKMRIAGAGGVFVEIPFVQRLSSSTFVVPMVEYSMEGEENEPETGREKFHNDYVNGLVYIKHFFGARGLNDPKVFVFLGPKLSYNISQKTDAEITDPVIQTAEDSLEDVQIGISFGGGYRFARNIEAYIRWDNGFNPVYINYPYGTFNYQLGAGINILFR